MAISTPASSRPAGPRPPRQPPGARRGCRLRLELGSGRRPAVNRKWLSKSRWSEHAGAGAGQEIAEQLNGLKRMLCSPPRLWRRRCPPTPPCLALGGAPPGSSRLPQLSSAGAGAAELEEGLGGGARGTRKSGQDQWGKKEGVLPSRGRGRWAGSPGTRGFCFPLPGSYCPEGLCTDWAPGVLRATLGRAQPGARRRPGRKEGCSVSSRCGAEAACLPGEVGKLSSGKLTQRRGTGPDPSAASVPFPALPSSLPVGMVFFALPGNIVSALGTLLTPFSGGPNLLEKQGSAPQGPRARCAWPSFLHSTWSGCSGLYVALTHGCLRTPGTQVGTPDSGLIRQSLHY